MGIAPQGVAEMPDGRLKRDIDDAKKAGLIGGVAATQAASVAADNTALRADFNALLAKLKAAGLVANA